MVGQGIKRYFFKYIKTASDFFKDFTHSVLSMLKGTFRSHNTMNILGTLSLLMTDNLTENLKLTYLNANKSKKQTRKEQS